METQTPAVPKPPGRTFTSLPTEIHLLVASNLTYPDALSLKHTNRHFYEVIDDDEELKIEWLIERRRLHLDCPHDRRCELGSDMRFCRGSVQLLMKRRREHGECEKTPGGRGCLVFGTKICTYVKPKPTVAERLKMFSLAVFGKLGILIWWLSLALLGAGISWIWMNKERSNAAVGTGSIELPE